MRSHIICLTPVRNEARRLPTFLDAAATWADAIVVADQGSTDGSREIARAHAKVTFVENPGTTLDNAARQRLLVDTARREFPGDRVLLLIDADEMLTAGAPTDPDWPAMLAAEPGTPIRMPWIHPLPGLERAWIPPRPKRFGLVDDGRPTTTKQMNPGRLPAAARPPVVLHRTGVLHFQYVHWESAKAKQRWYEVWHRLHFPERRPARVYRRYHRMDALPAEQIRPVDPEWWRGYEEAGLDVAAMARGIDAAQWDELTLKLLLEHGPERFRRTDLWDHDWSSTAAAIGAVVPPDPRRARDRWALRVLAATQGSRNRLVKGLAMRSVALARW